MQWPRARIARQDQYAIKNPAGAGFKKIVWIRLPA